MLQIKSAKEKFSINLVTNVKELTPEILAAVTDGIKLPPYHCVVVLAYTTKLLDIAININNDKEQMVSVIPLIAKANDEDLVKVNGAIGDRIVCDRSSLERGVHIAIPTMLSSKNVATYIRGDEVLRKNLLAGGDGTDKSIEFIKDASAKERQEIQFNKSPFIVTIEFKIIAINDISAFIPNGNKIIDPFKVVAKELVS